MDGVKEMEEMEENHEYICQQIDKIIQNNKKSNYQTYYPPVEETDKVINQYYKKKNC